jgi:hypothetical protein
MAGVSYATGGGFLVATKVSQKYQQLTRAASEMYEGTMRSKGLVTGIARSRTSWSRGGR